jgi:4-hydroxythreonine-4-phosphate dehydrogenase
VKKKVLEEGNNISGKSQDLKFVEKFEQINFDDGNKFFLDISKGKNHNYKLLNALKSLEKVFYQL